MKHNLVQAIDQIGLSESKTSMSIPPYVPTLIATIELVEYFECDFGSAIGVDLMEMVLVLARPPRSPDTAHASPDRNVVA